MRGRRLACLLLALTAPACAAAPAAAAPAPSARALYAGVARLNGQLALMGQGASALGLPPRRRTLSELRFENRDGYTISVVAFGQTVALDVSRARFRLRGRGGARRKLRERVLETTYLAHGRVTPGSIEASFGGLGRISMRFRPGGRQVRATRGAGCRKPSGAAIAQLGAFEGVLRFRGEGGYTAVDARRVPGRSVDLRALLACLLGVAPNAAASLPAPHAPLGIRLPGLVSPRGAPGVPSTPTHPSGAPRSTSLLASRKEALARLVFATQEREGGAARFLAVEQASAGSLGIVRLAYARGAAGRFSFDDALAAATVHPPAPFSGRAELRRGPGDAKSWSGPLAVSFLGAPGVPLTGPPFGVSLSQGF